MKKSISGEFTFKYTTYGILIGLSFPIIAIALELLGRSLEFSWQNIILLHKETISLYLIHLAPIAVGLAGFQLGKSLGKKAELMEKTEQQQKETAEKIFEFTEKLSKGDTRVEYRFDNLDHSQDNIGGSLVNLRDYIKKNKQEEEARRVVEQQQNWVTQGMARFGEILRQNNDNLNELSYNLISNLVNYVDAKQGGLFIINDNNPNDIHFELSACYAYSRKKFLERRIEWEEGLIGACALEKNTIKLTEVPAEHVTITSGLGEAKPDCIILVPLKVNDQVHGVIELAALKEFKEYEIDFIEKLAESIASVFSGVKINMQTARLLKESQEQAKILASQEDEMRRNMEELSFAQEEAAKQGELLANFTNAVNHTLVRAEYTTQGNLLYANTRFLSKLGYTSNKEVEGKHISIFINEKDKEWFFQIWEKLSKGGQHFEGDMKHVTKQGKDFWSMATYTCVRGSDGTIEKILFLGIDITEQKKQNLDFESQIDALNKNSIKIEYTTDGQILEANQKFLSITQINPDKIHDFTVFNFIDNGSVEKFKMKWDEILSGIPYASQFKVTTPAGEERWIEGTYNSVNDMYGDVSKVIFLAGDITQKKLVELENQQHTLKLIQQEEQLRNQQDEIKKQHAGFMEQMQKHIQEIESVKERNELTLEGALDAIVTINQEEKIELFNKAAEVLLGLNRNDVLGKSVKTILPPPYNKEKDGSIIDFLKSKKNHLKGNRTEVNVVNNKGEEIPVLLTLSEVKIGDKYTYTAFIQNISVELF